MCVGSASVAPNYHHENVDDDDDDDDDGDGDGGGNDDDDVADSSMVVRFLYTFKTQGSCGGRGHTITFAIAPKRRHLGAHFQDYAFNNKKKKRKRKTNCRPLPIQLNY